MKFVIDNYSHSNRQEFGMRTDNEHKVTQTLPIMAVNGKE